LWMHRRWRVPPSPRVEVGEDNTGPENLVSTR
jgi:hypothetical protein